MVNIEDYPIFMENKTNLKEASLDKGSGIANYMTESKIEVINFDKVKEKYIGNLHLPVGARSSDALYINFSEEGFFIEFKNGNLKEAGKRFEIREKIYDSILIFNDIVGENLEYTRKNLSFILVYNEGKNPLEIVENKKEIKDSVSRDMITNSVMGAAKERLIRFDLEKFKGFCFKDVITYTQDEFEREFIREIEN